MNAKAAELSTAALRTDAAALDMDAVEAWRSQAAEYLMRLSAIAAGVQSGDLDPALRLDAGAIEAFISTTARQHHLAVERLITGPVIAAGTPEQAASARTLLQDAGWFEQTWLELAPQLRAVAEGSQWIDPTEFEHDVAIMRELGEGLLAREASLAEVLRTAES